MSQIQSEVRPHVKGMPMSGFLLQTGGSARRRVIKPLKNQEPTTSFPIQNEYRVTGVPGHTHNSSAVVSVVCDLEKNRGIDATLPAQVWSNANVVLAAGDPGDSDLVGEEDERFSRALERGIGEIALRPENCHHEIREPVRSISEIRTLVAPDDRLQTLTYVEEVGGFRNQNKTVFTSDFPDVYVDLLGYWDIDEAAYEDPANPAGRSGDDEKTPMMIQSRSADAERYDGVVLKSIDVDNPSVGTLENGEPWFGIVRFKWDAEEMLYLSSPFVVTLKNVVEVRQIGDRHRRFPLAIQLH